ncbi:hypothetical protein pRALTA_0432 (plasmid) [Cupriavidus taiwanensis LMG 19424]|uniref:Uncharacterized protein n=2 Tax=Cupriavidus TaxID=106589 RepID=B2AJ29_CUPTR|nr:hypothetical protein pRALTA_0432 [Cupriavidus taiwanensis LMG 19424]SOZ16404.1 hypothetical protein CBM2597_P200003 [Cupriavidus taiwanensis]SOZ95275.1 hypothetical protein CBM2598_P180002 [Cupriavidus taiwanensis]SPD62433.1 conserved protein of unknown function [Cupriavidus neocaledonicus]
MRFAVDVLHAVAFLACILQTCGPMASLWTRVGPFRLHSVLSTKGKPERILVSLTGAIPTNLTFCPTALAEVP